MKKVSGLNKILIYHCVIILALLTSSCRNNQEILPDNTISVKYNNKIIDFKDVKLQEYYLDLDGGKGLRAFGEQNIVDENNYQYYIVVDFKNQLGSQYSVHKVNFGIKKRLTDNFFQLEVYAANLTNGYNMTNFRADISSNDKELLGSFGGKLLSITASETTISDGKYSLFLSTVK